MVKRHKLYQRVSCGLNTKTSYILDGEKYNIIEIGMNHPIPISIALFLTIYNVTLLSEVLTRISTGKIISTLDDVANVFMSKNEVGYLQHHRVSLWF